MTHIVIPWCPHCKAGEFYTDSDSLIGAGGFICCDTCGYPLMPDDNGLQNAAVDQAMNETKGQKLAWKPSEWVAHIRLLTDQIKGRWYMAQQQAWHEWADEKLGKGA